jgi:ArsR family transcriptional regulator, arsenate/arsenite/antimonite-responsive transcriptional repressor
MDTKTKPLQKTKADCCPPAMPSSEGFAIEGESAYLRLAALAKALGHPVRVEIIRILSQKQSCVCGEIVEELSMAQSTVSQHLKVLKDVGLIRGEIEGARTCYCLDHAVLRQFKILVAGL